MNADDFRNYMLSFVFLRYLSDNYEAAAKKELGSDHPKVKIDEAEGAKKTPLGIWYEQKKRDVADFALRRQVANCANLLLWRGGGTGPRGSPSLPLLGPV